MSQKYPYGERVAYFGGKNSPFPAYFIFTMPDRSMVKHPDFQKWKKKEKKKIQLSEQKDEEEEDEEEEDESSSEEEEDEEEEDEITRKYSIIAVTAATKKNKTIQTWSELENARCKGGILQPIEYFYATTVSYFFHEVIQVMNCFVVQDLLPHLLLRRWIFSHKILKRFSKQQQTGTLVNIELPEITTIMSGTTNITTKIISPIKPRVIKIYGCMFSFFIFLILYVIYLKYMIYIYM